MARYRCNTQCYWNGRVWKVGEEVDSNGSTDLPPHHFTNLDAPPPSGPPADDTPPSGPPVTDKAFEDMSIDELHGICDMLGVSKNGNKNTIIARLQAAQK